MNTVGHDNLDAAVLGPALDKDAMLGEKPRLFSSRR